MRGNRTVRYFSYFLKTVPQLTQKEKTILINRLKEKTLREIGINYNVTEGRIRQIEKGAIQKIKNKIYQMTLFK